ncbi:hypothetical protein [Oryza sativa Japonica Group]|uniref:Uncharacterized protein n=1 Tax=Oryza sativa subsp. japonica TaxID=39947 RepID=Q5N814_ORYSJ|nr:hypothetical protein [Oryza sativa Japonica Group]BAD87729.1 hypothetical protein [Oryza sativa Japonica Group]
MNQPSPPPPLNDRFDPESSEGGQWIIQIRRGTSIRNPRGTRRDADVPAAAAAGRRDEERREADLRVLQRRRRLGFL